MNTHTESEKRGDAQMSIASRCYEYLETFFVILCEHYNNGFI